jgi:hypothetical protein
VNRSAGIHDRRRCYAEKGVSLAVYEFESVGDEAQPLYIRANLQLVFDGWLFGATIKGDEVFCTVRHGTVQNMSSQAVRIGVDDVALGDETYAVCCADDPCPDRAVSRLL